jgi:hypothetical protein
MKAANDQFESDNSGLMDSLLSGAVSEAQGLGQLVEQEAAIRAARGTRQTALTGGNVVNGAGDVYLGPEDSLPNINAPAPAGGANSDVYWGVNSDPAIQAASNRVRTAGSSPDVYWGTPSVDLYA